MGTSDDDGTPESSPGLIDPDSPASPLHFRPFALALVALGGCLGAPARYLIGAHWGAGTESVPWTTFAINIVGAFALGLLLESLRRAGPDTGRRLKLRLLLGTGFLGTFTTYSSLAVEADLLIYHGRPAVAAGYAALSVCVGLVAVVAGIMASTAAHRLRATGATP